MVVIDLCPECGHDRWIVFRNVVVALDRGEQLVTLLRCAECGHEQEAAAAGATRAVADLVGARDSL